MDLKEAVTILRRHSGSMHEHAAAASFVYSFYSTEGKHLMRPFTPRAVAVNDSAPRRTSRRQPTLEERKAAWRDLQAVCQQIRDERDAKQKPQRTRDQVQRDEVAADSRWCRRSLQAINAHNARRWGRGQ
jgi:hypothetical protein